MVDKMTRPNSNRHGGAWQETAFNKIDLPFTIENLKSILSYALDAEPLYTHQQIADWCYRFWWELDEGSLSGNEDPLLDKAAEIALDVDAQWGLYLINEYSVDELLAMDFSKVTLPYEWFREWHIKLMAHVLMKGG
jgi:hypothetical protein